MKPSDAKLGRRKGNARKVASKTDVFGGAGFYLLEELDL